MKKLHSVLVLLIMGLALLTPQVGYSMPAQAACVNKNDNKVAITQGATNEARTYNEELAKMNKLVAQNPSKVINCKDANGCTPLMDAVNACDRKLFDTLCSEGAFKFAHDNQGRTAYYYATERLEECARKGHVGHEHCCPLAYMQEQLKGDINEVDPSNDMTPLMTACQAGNQDMVFWLLVHAADVKKVGKYNKTKTAYNVTNDEKIKALLNLQGAKEFEAEYQALQSKKREEIRLKLLQNQQKKQLEQGQNKVDIAEKIKTYLLDSENNLMTIKHAVFSHVFSMYKETVNDHLETTIIECKKDLLQKATVGLLHGFKKQGRAPEEVEDLLGKAVVHMAMQAGEFLGEKRLASMGYKKNGPLHFSDLVQLAYAQDKKITKEVDKIDADINIILFMSHWKRIRPLLEGVQDTIALTPEQIDTILLQIKNSNRQLPPEQAQVISHVLDGIYSLLLPDYSRVIQAVAKAQDSLGNSLLHYAVIVDDFELANQLTAAHADLEKPNAKNMAPFELIIKMGHVDKLKDLLSSAGNSIKPVQFKKAVPTALEVQDLLRAPAAAGAGAGRRDAVQKDMKKDFEQVQDDLKKNILRTALVRVPSPVISNPVMSSAVVVPPAQIDTEKLAQLQKAQELERARLAEEQAAQKVAKQAAKQAAKKERRKATKLDDERAIAQQKLEAEKNHREEQALAFKKIQEQAQQKRIQAHKVLEQEQAREKESKLELDQQSQEAAAQNIYFKHIARPDIYADDQAPTNYAQWLHEHRLAEGAYCGLCNNAQVIKTRDYQEDAVQEQLQRRIAARDSGRKNVWLTHEEINARLTREEINRIESEFGALSRSQQFPKTVQASKEQVVAHLQALEQQRQAAEQQKKEDELKKKQADQERYNAHLQIINLKLQEAEQQRKEKESRNKEGLQKSFNTVSQKAS